MEFLTQLNNPSQVGSVLQSAGVPYLLSPDQPSNLLDNGLIGFTKFPIITGTIVQNLSAIISPEVLAVGFPAAVNAIAAARLKPWSLILLVGNIQVSATNPSNAAADGTFTGTVLVPAYGSNPSRTFTSFQMISPNATGNSISGYSCDGPLMATSLSINQSSGSAFTFNYAGEIYIYQTT